MDEFETTIVARSQDEADRIMAVMLDHETREAVRGTRSAGSRKIKVEILDPEASRSEIEPEAEESGPSAEDLRRRMASL